MSYFFLHSFSIGMEGFSGTLSKTRVQRFHLQVCNRRHRCHLAELGVVQVGSLIPGNGSYPSRVTVSLGAKVRSVYFLLGCAGYASVGTEVGLIATKVSDPLALVYGKNVIAVDDSGNGLEDPGAVQHTFTLAGKTEPCNLTVLELESEVEFDQVEFEARGTGAAPFMLAITKK